MIKRELENQLLVSAQQYPVVTVLGPRQSGKTTLVKAVFSDKPYVNLEAPDTRELAEYDPRGFLAKYPEGAILDEIQRIPKLLSYIQVIVDENPSKGRYILTGSHQLRLHESISQSLAGRTSLLSLYPLSLGELKASCIVKAIDEQLFTGFFPRIYSDDLDVMNAHRNYVQSYIERDVRQLIDLKDLSLFQKFLKLCAGRIGRELNTSALANEVGTSSHTITHWLSVLEASFVIFLLRPYFENLGKRVIKSPKLYFIDTGIASYLLDIESPSQISRDPLRGNLFENLVVMDLVKTRVNQGKDHQLFFYRDNQQNEVDVIFKTGHQLVPIEIKSSQTWHPEFIKNIEFFKKLVPERVNQGFLVYGGADEQTIKNISLLNYHNSYLALL